MHVVLIPHRKHRATGHRLNIGKHLAGVATVAAQIQVAVASAAQLGDRKALSLGGLFGEQLVKIPEDIQIPHHLLCHGKDLALIVAANELPVDIRGDQLDRMVLSVIENKGAGV